MNTDALEIAENAVKQANEVLSKVLRKQITDFTVALSQMVPHKTVTFTSAMGPRTFFFDDEVEEVDNKVTALWDRLLDDYGYNVIPIFKLVVKNGTILKDIEDW